MLLATSSTLPNDVMLLKSGRMGVYAMKTLTSPVPDGSRYTTIVLRSTGEATKQNMKPPRNKMVGYRDNPDPSHSLTRVSSKDSISPLPIPRNVTKRHLEHQN